MDPAKAQQLIFEKIKNLPTLPDVAQKLITLIQDERTSAGDLSKLLSYDQAISLRLLKVANSAYYGFSKEIATTQHAIVVLGMEEVKRLSLGIAMVNFMNKANDKSSLIMQDFWKHSVGSSLASQIISKKVDVASDIASTSSLFHDIGKLVLDSLFCTEYKSVLDKAKNEGVNIVDVEKEILGFGHADVGLWIGNKWNLPPSLVTPIAYHHQVEEADQENIRDVAIVHLADIVCHKAGIGTNGTTAIPSLNRLAQETLQVAESDLETMVQGLQSEEEKVQAFISAIQ